MKFLFERDTWQEVYESLSKNKLRTILTMVGVWWGILLLIGLLGAARGLENSFNRLFGDFATNSVFVWGQSTSKPFKGFQEGRQVQLSLTDAKKVESGFSYNSGDNEKWETVESLRTLIKEHVDATFEA